MVSIQTEHCADRLQDPADLDWLVCHELSTEPHRLMQLLDSALDLNKHSCAMVVPQRVSVRTEGKAWSGHRHGRGRRRWSRRPAWGPSRGRARAVRALPTILSVVARRRGHDSRIGRIRRQQ
jgi:hypothetical protein